MTTFTGFYPETLKFFAELEENNHQAWFEFNKPKYEQYVMGPARVFVPALGDELQKLRPDMQAIPKVNKSLFRINRDVRFSKDKRPYKTHLGMLWWEGGRPRMECPSVYVQVDATGAWIGLGLYVFTPEQLQYYRQRVADPKVNKTLRGILKTIQVNPTYEIITKRYKRKPADYRDIPDEDGLLQYDGMWAGINTRHHPELYTKEFVPFCIEQIKPILPLYEWLVREFV